VQRLDWSVEAAVNQFAQVRPPGIYKKEYLVKLFQLYGDVEDTPLPPVMPQWHTECDDEEALGGSTMKGEPHYKKRRTENVHMKATFMKGIPNVRPAMDIELVTEVQHRIKELCGFQSSGFPGCQPVSMNPTNLQFLRKPYVVSWKADGTR